MSEVLLTPEKVAEHLGVHAVTLDRLVRRGEFPAPVKIAGRRRWRRETVDAHIVSLEG